MNHKVLGIYIRSYIKYRGVSKQQKIIAILTLWITMSISIYMIDKPIVKILLVLIGLGVTTHILMLRTLTKDEMIELEKMRDEGKDANMIQKYQSNNT